MNIFHLDLKVAMESNSFNEAGKVQYMKMLSQKSITQMLLSAPPVKKAQQRSSSPCPHEHSKDLKGQQHT